MFFRFTLINLFAGLLISSCTSYSKDSTDHCKKFVPFLPIDKLKADIKVYRFNKYIPGEGNSEVDEKNELICETKKPVIVEVKDIRKREGDWYYCDELKPANYISCDTEYKSQSAKIIVKPSIVIRSWKPNDALDTHMHVHLLPGNDKLRLLDNFTQSITFDLNQRNITLIGSAGGREKNSDQDYYYVRVKFYK